MFFADRHKTPAVLMAIGTIGVFLAIGWFFTKNNEPHEVPEQINAVQPVNAAPAVDQPGNAADGQ